MTDWWLMEGQVVEDVAIEHYGSLPENAGATFNDSGTAAWAGLHNSVARDRGHYHCPAYAVTSRTGGELSCAWGL